MKGVSVIFILLILEARGSFLDDFRGAISNINRGFGKLIGDVVTNVGDTLYCTISAVEQMMVLNGYLDKRTLYNKKCKGIEKPKVQTLSFRDGSQSRTISKIRKHSVIHHKHSTKRFSHESGNTVKNVNKTIIDVLGDQMDLKNVSDTIGHEAKRLSEIRKMLEQETENISEKLKNEMRQLHLDHKSSPVESIWEEIKFLNELRRKSKNDTEVEEIRRVLDKVTEEMHLKIDNRQILDNHELEELKKELLKFASNTEKFNGTEQQNLSSKKESNTSIHLNNGGLNLKKGGTTHTQKLDSQPQEKSIFNLGMDSLSSFFDSMSSPDDLKSVKQIITDSQYSEKLTNHTYKGQRYVFSKR